MVSSFAYTRIDGVSRHAVYLFDHHRTAAGLVVAGTVVVLAVIALPARRLFRVLGRQQWRGDEVGSVLAAAIATGVSAQGMWVFMTDALRLPIMLRLMFFGFLEVMTVTSALRARTAQRATGSAGVDGVAMWALTCLSAVLSATEAANPGTLLIRLSAPLVAAWGWERGMALERRLYTGHRARINWRITPERLLIGLGLADADQQCTASDEAAHRSLIAVALAVDDARALRDTDNPNPRKVRKAQQRLRAAMRRATCDSGLVPVAGRDCREVLLDHIAILRSTSALLDIDTPTPWPGTVHGPGTPVPLLRSDVQHDAPVDGDVDAAVQATSAPGVPPATADHEQAPSNGAAHDAALHTRITGLDAIADHQLWTTVAERFCADHPARRRHRTRVEAVLRLHHIEHRTYPEIAREVGGFSKHAVGRVIRQARPYHPVQPATKHQADERT